MNAFDVILNCLQSIWVPVNSASEKRETMDIHSASIKREKNAKRKEEMKYYVNYIWFYCTSQLDFISNFFLSSHSGTYWSIYHVCFDYTTLFLVLQWKFVGLFSVIRFDNHHHHGERKRKKIRKQKPTMTTTTTATTTEKVKFNFKITFWLFCWSVCTYRNRISCQV